MPHEQMLIGGATAAMCLAGLWHQSWLLTHTRKGQRLVQWCGDASAPWVLRALLAAGFGFGLLLALGFVNPRRSDAPQATTSRPAQRRQP